MIKEGHFNLSTILNLKGPMDVPYEYIQTRAYDINTRSMNLYEQVLYSYGDKNEWRVGEHLFNVAYLSVLTSSICEWNFEVAATLAWLHEV